MATRVAMTTTIEDAFGSRLMTARRFPAEQRAHRFLVRCRSRTACRSPIASSPASARARRWRRRSSTIAAAASPWSSGPRAARDHQLRRARRSRRARLGARSAGGGRAAELRQPQRSDGARSAARAVVALAPRLRALGHATRVSEHIERLAARSCARRTAGSAARIRAAKARCAAIDNAPAASNEAPTMSSASLATAHRIVIVGGGAGGLPLATQLGDTLGRRGRAEVTLVDRNATHLWKPLLHEVAAGRMDADLARRRLLPMAYWHHFRFRVRGRRRARPRATRAQARRRPRRRRRRNASARTPCLTTR